MNWTDISDYVVDNLDRDKFYYEYLDEGIEVYIPMSSKSHYDTYGDEIKCSKLFFKVYRSYTQGTFYIKKKCICCDNIEEELHNLSYDDTIKLIDKYLNTKPDHKSAITMIKNIVNNISD